LPDDTSLSGYARDTNAVPIAPTAPAAGSVSSPSLTRASLQGTRGRVLINDLDVITASKSCHVVFGTDFLACGGISPLIAGGR